MEQLTLIVDFFNYHSTQTVEGELSRSGHIVILTSQTAKCKMWSKKTFLS